MRTFIIAEAGVNHNGDIQTAKKLVDAASDAGADAVKFQTFKADTLVCRNAPKAGYQTETTGADESQYEMIKKLELDENTHKELVEYCRKRDLKFLSSPFDPDSIDLLDRLGLEIFKVPSGEITNLPYLRKTGGLGKKVILSTGMSDLEEIEDALNILTEAGTPLENITVLHCNTEYPTPYEDVNLNAMLSIKKRFGVRVGYSDHTTGFEVSVAAAALGAEVIEKHFTLDKLMSGPDHKASLDPDELKTMVSAIRNIERSMGDGIKRLSPSELKNKIIVRKSIVASRHIQKGEILSAGSITVRRPGTGISPMEWDNVIGTPAIRDFNEDSLIEI